MNPPTLESARPNPFSAEDHNPARHKIFTPNGNVKIPARTSIEKMLRYSQPVILERIDWSTIHWQKAKRNRRYNIKAGYVAQGEVVVADQAWILGGEQTRNLEASDLTEENSDWWTVSICAPFELREKDGATENAPLGERWEIADDCRDCYASHAAEELAVVKQARHVACSGWMVGWDETDLDGEPTAAAWPLDAIAQKMKMERLPCVGLPLSEFVKAELREGQDWRGWLAEETILLEDDPLPDSEPVVAQIRYHYNPDKERYDRADVFFDLDGLRIISTEEYWI